MRRFILYLKGVCMGASDVIPGVSGGTMALILGIYKRLIDAIRGLHLGWVPPLWRWLTDGRRAADWKEFRGELATLDLPFLLTLGAGIVSAIVVGSMVIPGLMESYPVAMRAFFFGLIVASIWIPFRMIEAEQTSMLVGGVLIALVTAAFGYVVTDPGRTLEATQTMKEVESRGESLKAIARRGPSAAAEAQVYWMSENESLREAIREADPDKAETFATQHKRLEREGGGTPSKDELKKLSEPYQKLHVPEGVVVEVPRPAPWYLFLAGAVAICAMILPGISGSFILLILGAYFFVLNAVKGSIEQLAAGYLPLEQIGFVSLFMVGAAIGILSFARLLSYLLETHPTPTLAGLVGLMIGCLRGIWPFRATIEGETVNVLPSALDATVMTAAGTCLLGAVIVAALTVAGRYIEDPGEADAEGLAG
jgi:putative membrane protein